MNHHLLDVAIPNDWDRRGLPGWAYHSDALLELEKEHVFRNHWQIVGHVSDVPEPGDYLTMDVVGERALIVRGKDGEVRAFHNICRHRGSRVVADNQGNCKNALVCPFHGWVYNLDGTLRGAARPRSFPDLDKTEFGLVPLELEIWNGLDLHPLPQGAAAFGRRTDGAGRPRNSRTTSSPRWCRPTASGRRRRRSTGSRCATSTMRATTWPWRIRRCRISMASTYFDEPFVNGVSRSFATYNPHAGRRWSVRNYVKLAPEATHLPEHLRKAWVYYGMFPNMVISVMPESVQFYQEFPLSTGETLLRGAIYQHRDETREQAAARYLSFRIDRETMSEDVQLSVWSNESMLSQAFEGFYLSDLEYGVRTPSRPSARHAAGARPGNRAGREGHGQSQRRAEKPRLRRRHWLEALILPPVAA